MIPDIRGEKGLSLGLFIVAIALGGVGIAFISIAQQTGSLAQYSRTWTKTSGEITEARVETREGKNHPVVEYTYTAGEKQHKGTRLFLTEGPYANVEKAEDGIRVTHLNEHEKPVTTEYRKGADVPVFYNPHLTSESAVNTIALKGMGGFILIGIGALAAAIFFGFRSFMYD